MKIIDQFGEILWELQQEEGDLNEDQIEMLIGEMLIPELVSRFAEKFTEMTECHDYDPSEDYLNDLFHTFSKVEGLSEELQDEIAATINLAAMYEAAAQEVAPETIYSQPDDTDDDDEDEGTILDYWKNLSDVEKKQKVKNFLKKLSTAHIGMRDCKPFFKTTIGDKPDRFGNKFGKGVKLFDREANRFGHSNEAIQFPNIFNQGHEDPRSHPLHQTLVNHGFEYSHTTPVNQRDGSIHNHHTWTHPHGHLIGAYANDTRWSSKTSAASGHAWEGIGTKALDQHLKNKAKRYKKQNNEAVAHVDILENLLSGHDKIQRYADFMKNNPATAFGHAGSYAVQSPVNDLREGWNMRKEHEKKFRYGKKRRSKLI